MPSHHDLDAYDYHLPEELIAQNPLSTRDASRLMVVDRTQGTIEHRYFFELDQILDEQDTLVVNNTKVLRARLLGNRILPTGEQGGAIEFLMLEPRTDLSGDTGFFWEGMMRSAAKQARGFRFAIPVRDGSFLEGELIRGSQDSPEGTVVARFDRDPLALDVGEIPLPPYIEREATNEDLNTYQTIFAQEARSAAAPTAGLHFTPELIQRIRGKGIGFEELTLHVGLGTFRPVKVSDIREHRMHEEAFTLSADTARVLEATKSEGGRIVAVGTTSVRALESAAVIGANGLELNAGTSRTSIFIYPGYYFQAVDRLITNFHLPKSSLLMLVSAFAGYDLIRQAYAEAVKEKYRFFSYGDAMLIL